LVDHSSGHDKKRPDGLNAKEMNKEYGGIKPKLRSTMIEEEVGYLGPLNRILSVGMRQSLVFSSQAEGTLLESRLQYVGQKLGLMIDRSPKYHPECAGEGIE
jgi:hypothetical protein